MQTTTSQKIGVELGARPDAPRFFMFDKELQASYSTSGRNLTTNGRHPDQVSEQYLVAR